MSGITETPGGWFCNRHGGEGCYCPPEVFVPEILALRRRVAELETLCADAAVAANRCADAVEGNADTLNSGRALTAHDMRQLAARLESATHPTPGDSK